MAVQGFPSAFADVGTIGLQFFHVSVLECLLWTNFSLAKQPLSCSFEDRQQVFPGEQIFIFCPCILILQTSLCLSLEHVKQEEISLVQILGQPASFSRLPVSSCVCSVHDVCKFQWHLQLIETHFSCIGGIGKLRVSIFPEAEASSVSFHLEKNLTVLESEGVLKTE